MKRDNYIYIYIYILCIWENHMQESGHWSNEQSVCQWFGRPGFNLKSSHTKDLKNGT